VRARAILLAAALIAAGSGGASAQQMQRRTLAGIVTDTTRNPIPRVEIGLIERREIVRTVRTGDDGRFELVDIPAGKTTFVVRRLGFQPRTYTVQIRDGARRAFLPIVLDPMPAELEKVIVMARVAESGGRLKDFYERRARNAWGSFIEREQIERRNPIWMSDMLRMTPGVRVVPGPNGRQVVRLRGCAPTLWLDGMPLRGTELDEVVIPSEVAGIEVYRSSAGLPPQFMDMTGCGAIIVWTRVQ
jgi:Carboxypeptidase regulatory-like domain/TonB-dependent Receptor Plug Domain